jgi:hypothetical protein
LGKGAAGRAGQSRRTRSAVSACATRAADDGAIVDDVCRIIRDMHADAALCSSRTGSAVGESCTARCAIAASSACAAGDIAITHEGIPARSDDDAGAASPA